MSAVFAYLKRRPELTPLAVTMAFGIILPASFGARTLLSSNDVVLNKSQPRQFGFRDNPRLFREDTILAKRLQIQEGKWLRWW